jgi:cysteine desulfurase / selenocysteine lyase
VHQFPEVPVTPIKAVSPAGGTPLPVAAPAGSDLGGLRQFVAQVRGGHHRALPDVRLPDLAHDAARSVPESPLISTLPATGPIDVAAVRRDFPILSERVHGKPLVWLDNAATTQKPQVVIDALAHFYAHDNSNIHRAAHELAARATEAYESARRTVQEFLGASRPEEVIFVRGCTEGVNLVANILAPSEPVPSFAWPRSTTAAM